VRAEIGTLDPFVQEEGTGTLGRLADALKSQGNSVNLFAVDTSFKTLEGHTQAIRKIALDSTSGFAKLNPYDPNLNMLQRGDQLNGDADGRSSVFSDTWASTWVRYTSFASHSSFCYFTFSFRHRPYFQSTTPVMQVNYYGLRIILL